MIRPISIVFALAAIAGLAGVAWWMTRTPEPSSATPVADVADVPRVQKAPSSDMPPPGAAKPKHLRRLLSTRLDNPKLLQIRNVRVSRVERYAGVACGEVAWGATPAQAETFHRFIATRRIAHVEGKQAGFDALWQQVCEPARVQR